MALDPDGEGALKGTRRNVILTIPLHEALELRAGKAIGEGIVDALKLGTHRDGADEERGANRWWKGWRREKPLPARVAESKREREAREGRKYAKEGKRRLWIRWTLRW